MIKLTFWVLLNMTNLCKKIRSGLFRSLENCHQGFGKIHFYLWAFGFLFVGFNFKSYSESLGNTCFYFLLGYVRTLKNPNRLEDVQMV